MNKKQTRKRIDACYADMHRAEAIIANIRKECKHEEFENGNYMWAPGHINYTRICKFCDTPLGVEGSYTFKFHDISKHKDILPGIIKENFMKTYKGSFAVYSDTGEPAINFDTNIYSIELNPSYHIIHSKDNIEENEYTPEECKEFANKIESICKEAGITVEILPYIVHI